MIGIQFVAQDLNTKEKVTSSMTYFPEMNEHVEHLISANRIVLARTFTNHRILVYTVNLEDS